MLALHRENAFLLVVDVQDRLASAMPKAALADLEKNAAVLIRAARRLGLPVVATEQYPKGLGRTLPALRELLQDAPMEKLEFSCAKAGATLTSTEAVLFDLLGVAGTPEFKELAPLIK
jgi:nicotinamidase-related amidase